MQILVEENFISVKVNKDSFKNIHDVIYEQSLVPEHSLLPDLQQQPRVQIRHLTVQCSTE